MNESGKKPRKSRNTGQVVERGPDKYLLRIFIGRDTTGKRHYHNETFHGKKGGAKEQLRKLLTKLNTGEPLKLSNNTLGAFLDEWLKANPDLKTTSIDHYRDTLRLYVRPKLGGLLLTKIESNDVQSLYGEMIANQYAPSTIGLVHTLLNSAFKLALRRRKIVFNPMDGVTAPTGKKSGQEAQERREDRVLTVDQVEKFLNAADETRFGPILTLAFHTGCRPGELLGLKWENLEASSMTLKIRQTIHWPKGGAWYLDTPKTAVGRRNLRLTDYLVEMLAQHRKRQLEERMKAGSAWSDHGLIFTDEVGEPYSQGRLRYYFKQILLAAGLPDHFNPYSARHTSATLLMASGINAKTVSDRLGHSDVRITLKTYTHPTAGMQNEASEEIERVLRRQK